MGQLISPLGLEDTRTPLLWVLASTRVSSFSELYFSMFGILKLCAITPYGRLTSTLPYKLIKLLKS